MSIKIELPRNQLIRNYQLGAQLHRIIKTNALQMTKVEIYTWQFCPFCIKAKALLKKKRVQYIEYSIDRNDEAREEMTIRADGRRTVPQIFINDIGIGGCDELHSLEQNNELDKLLRG